MSSDFVLFLSFPFAVPVHSFPGHQARRITPTIPWTQAVLSRLNATVRYMISGEIEWHYKWYEAFVLESEELTNTLSILCKRSGAY